MQEDARDSLEVFKFDLIEETIGRLLRAVILRLEEKRSSILDLPSSRRVKSGAQSSCPAADARIDYKHATNGREGLR